jgi:hypothetical protein
LLFSINEKENDDLVQFDYIEELIDYNDLEQIVKLDIQSEQESEGIIEADI